MRWTRWKRKLLKDVWHEHGWLLLFGARLVSSFPLKNRKVWQRLHWWRGAIKQNVLYLVFVYSYKSNLNIFTHCWTEHQLLCTSNPLAEICCFFLNICVPFPILKQIKLKSNVSALCLDFKKLRAILQALHVCALLSRSNREMKLIVVRGLPMRVYLWQNSIT